ncbi:PEP-CTERM sorting domain-containing protein [Verrucomicrobiaceae bacterium 5K15]|uniref:PEP-CTERM sorting domain-containing protein n=1 Tax=Oceaniferula flava TaxID=2800421 RepID=A0AAE2SE82_9BACT|nr:PEP-CTERM sorting domain-containing protein [Oceaniferula flavus]MBK1856268.1 PEP-CTERM sorting domain-containing protein [Oceaniferula flavus]MBM1137575.1 PEP-CTERM sorting domain-containing protein [Oceaniferula flavus]
MKYQMILLAALIAASNTHATVVAKFDSFTHTSNNPVLASDSSAQSSWTTTNLTDHATGTGALSAGNQESANRKTNDFGVTNAIQFSSLRELDSGPTITPVGNSSWVTFSVSATGSDLFNFVGQSATADTFAEGTGLGGTVSADWSMYYSLNGGSSWTLLSSETGASISGSGGESAATGVSWDLSGIGSVASVDFLIDPLSTGSTNGNVSQRGVGIGNIVVNADLAAVPEPSSSALLGLSAVAMMLRRRR